MITAASLIDEALELAKRRLGYNYSSLSFDPTQPISLHSIMSRMDSLDMVEYAMDLEEALWDRNCHVNFDHEFKDDVAICETAADQTRENFDAAALRIAEAIAKRCNKE